MTALTLAPARPLTLYAAASGGIGLAWVLRSDDGGGSWAFSAELSAPEGLWALAVHPKTDNVIYAIGDGIFRSIDGGRIWEQVYKAGATLRSIAIHPANSDLIYATGHVIYRGSSYPTGKTDVAVSTDGGKTWLPPSQKNWQWNRNVVISPVAPHRVLMALDAEGVAVQDSPPLEPTPTPPPGLDPSDIPTIVYADVLAFDVVQHSSLYALAVDPPALGRSYDGGDNWDIYPLPDMTNDPPIALVARPDASLVSLGRHTVYHLVQGQAGFESRHLALPDDDSVNAPPSRPLLLDPSDPDVLLTSAAQGILRSEDGGRVWTRYTFPTSGPDWPEALASAPGQPAILYALVKEKDGALAGQIMLRSDDGGRNWAVQAQLDRDVHLETLAVHPLDPEIVYGGGKGLYQSGDGGRTWTPLHPDLTVYNLSLTPDDPRLIYAITDEGVILSADGGLTWTTLCPDVQANRPAQFLKIAVSPVEPHPLVLLARPTRADLPRPTAGLCQGSDLPRYDLHQDWEKFKQGLPAFVERYED